MGRGPLATAALYSVRAAGMVARSPPLGHTHPAAGEPRESLLLAFVPRLRLPSSAAVQETTPQEAKPRPVAVYAAPTRLQPSGFQQEPHSIDIHMPDLSLTKTNELREI
eukprot:GGOE01040443.1.p2 GENE.GGOE01040443.1~~GGOE01040443.1.p2  ORF type:complete len:109 (+),score=3.10 GGOE01040443.1:59-385(+)